MKMLVQGATRHYMWISALKWQFLGRTVLQDSTAFPHFIFFSLNNTFGGNTLCSTNFCDGATPLHQRSYLAARRTRKKYNKTTYDDPEFVKMPLRRKSHPSNLSHFKT